MTIEPEMLKSLVKAAAEQVIASAPELTALDQAIGDGDHGINMKRGFEAVAADAAAAELLGLAPGTLGSLAACRRIVDRPGLDLQPHRAAEGAWAEIMWLGRSPVLRMVSDSWWSKARWAAAT